MFIKNTRETPLRGFPTSFIFNDAFSLKVYSQKKNSKRDQMKKEYTQGKRRRANI